MVRGEVVPMKAKTINILPVSDINKIEFTLTVDRNFQNIQKLNDLAQVVAKGKELKVDLKQYRKRRSLDANSYSWILCDKIAKVIGNTKEFVYQEAIKAVGEFEIVPIKDEAVERWQKNWESKGLGWQSEVMGDSKIKGYTNTINYFGSSTYNSLEFSKLLEEIIFQAKELGIETMTPDEQAELMATYKAI